MKFDRKYHSQRGFIEVERKPRKCPKCGSVKVANILYGLPAWDPEMEKEIEEGRIVLGGCMVSDDDPEWQCVDCGLDIYKSNNK